MTAETGTYRWMAPEVVTKLPVIKHWETLSIKSNVCEIHFQCLKVLFYQSDYILVVQTADRMGQI